MKFLNRKLFLKLILTNYIFISFQSTSGFKHGGTLPLYILFQRLVRIKKKITQKTSYHHFPVSKETLKDMYSKKTKGLISFPCTQHLIIYIGVKSNWIRTETQNANPALHFVWYKTSYSLPKESILLS